MIAWLRRCRIAVRLMIAKNHFRLTFTAHPHRQTNQTTRHFHESEQLSEQSSEGKENFESTWKQDFQKVFLAAGNCSMANWNSNERFVMNNLTFKYFSLFRPLLWSKLFLLKTKAIHFSFAFILHAWHNLIRKNCFLRVALPIPLKYQQLIQTNWKGRNAGKMKNG